MKRLTLPLAILASSVALAAISQGATADQTKTKQLQVRSAAEVKSTFDIAAAERGRQAIEISCHPASSDWCANGFVSACNKAKGGLSSNDGGVTCSLPQWQ